MIINMSKTKKEKGRQVQLSEGITEFERAIINRLRTAHISFQNAVLSILGLPYTEEGLKLAKESNFNINKTLQAEQEKALRKYKIEGYGNKIEIGKAPLKKHEQKAKEKEGEAHVLLTYLEIDIINRIRRADIKEKCRVFDALGSPYTSEMDVWKAINIQSIKDETRQRKEWKKHEKRQNERKGVFEEEYKTKSIRIGEGHIETT